MTTPRRCNQRSAVLFPGLAAMVVLAAVTAYGQINPASPAPGWTAVLYPAGSPVTPDPFSDQQTGSKEADIVGSTSVASFYTQFFNGGTPSLIDGQLAFRLRLAEEQNPVGFSAGAFIGIDGNADGKLDIFVGVDNSGTADHVGIWQAGNGLNVSPSTTSIVSPPVFSYSETSVNYSWTPVNAAIDPTTISYDVDGGANVDHFLSFVVPFADLITMFGSAGVLGVNENTIFTYVAATATQDNSLNQDLNGVNGGVNSPSTWADLGALTERMTAGGVTVPEPSTYALMILGAAALWWAKRARRVR